MLSLTCWSNVVVGYRLVIGKRMYLGIIGTFICSPRARSVNAFYLTYEDADAL